jgi:hypothetical protein
MDGFEAAREIVNAAISPLRLRKGAKTSVEMTELGWVGERSGVRPMPTLGAKNAPKMGHPEFVARHRG